MRNSGGVRFGQGAGDLNADTQRLTQWRRPAFQTPVQRLSVNKFLRNEMDIVDLIYLENGDDVRMVERRGRARFLLEALHPLLISSELLRQEFERQLTSEPGILREINFSHSARPQKRKNLVSANLPPH